MGLGPLEGTDVRTLQQIGKHIHRVGIHSTLSQSVVSPKIHDHKLAD